MLYRRTDGQVTALEDACWHRLPPLSLGHLKEDEVVCGYQPGSSTRPGAAPTCRRRRPSTLRHAYPVVERHRLVWLWPGDPALADPAKIPDFHWNDGTDWVGEATPLRSRLRLSARHRQPHGPDARDLCPCGQHRRRGHHQRALRRNAYRPHGHRDPLDDRHRGPPFWAKQLDKPGHHVDRWQIIYFHALRPSWATWASPSPGPRAAQGDGLAGVNGAFLAAITLPEKTCHYFWFELHAGPTTSSSPATSSGRT